MRHTTIPAIYVLVYVAAMTSAASAAPVTFTCTGADYVVADYDGLRATAGTAGASAEVTNVRTAGCFSYSATDVLGHGDDDGIQIAASGGGFWIRHVAGSDASASISRSEPIELDWFSQVADGYNLTGLHEKLAVAYAPNLYIRAPSTAVADSITLYWDGTWNLSCTGHGIERFRYLESDATVVLKWKSGSHRFLLFDEPKSTESNCNQTVYEFVFGSAAEKDDRDSYNLWVDGGVEGPSTSHEDNLIEVRNGAKDGPLGAIKYDVIWRANLRNAQSSGLRVIGAGNAFDTMRVGGRYESAPLNLSGATVAILEDTVYYSDPYAKWAGWTGSGTATDYDTYGDHDFKCEFKHLGRLEGAIEMQYGGPHWFLSGVPMIGKGPSDPFVMIGKDMGYLGPASGAGGTAVDKPRGVGTQWGKTDPITYSPNGSEKVHWKYVYGPHEHGLGNFATAPKLEATPGGNPPWYINNATFYLENISADWAGNIDPDGEAVYEGNTWVVASGVVGHSGTLKDVGKDALIHGTDGTGTFGTIHLNNDDFVGRPHGGVPCTGATVRDLTITGSLIVDAECAGAKISNVTWQGPPRTIMTIGRGAHVTATNIAAPVGSTIEGSGTLVLNGAQVALPYKIDGSEGSGGEIGSRGPWTNRPPDAQSQSAVTQRDRALRVVLGARDPDGDRLTYAVRTRPQRGKLKGRPPHLTYMPDAGYVGSDSFTFKVNDGEASSGDATVRITVNGANSMIQNQNLEPGWNTVALYVDPGVKSIAWVLADILPHLVLLKNRAGEVYYPQYGINEIGAWNIQEAYDVYLESAATLSIRGNPIAASAAVIRLTEGWNLAPYPLTSELPISRALSSIARELVMVKNHDGQVYYPDYGIEEFSTMKPGHGYYIYMSKKANLKYPVSGSRLSAWKSQ